jgi:hypothetical protein
MSTKHEDPKAGSANSARDSLQPLANWSQERGRVPRFGISKIRYTPGPVEVLPYPDKSPRGLAQNFNGYRMCCTSEPDGLEFKKYGEDGLMSVPSPNEVDLFKSNVSTAQSDPAIKAFLDRNPKFYSLGPL